MEALEGAASHKPCTTQLAGRVTVYVETSVESLKSWEVTTCKQLTTRDCDRVGEISGTPAG
jgi:hypothetical protein